MADVSEGTCAVPTGGGLPDKPVRCALRPPRPLLLWDGQCAFCERWARRLKRLAGSRLDCAPYQRRMADFPEIAPAWFERAVFLILPDGTALHSARAVFRAMALRQPFGIPDWLYRNVPPFGRFCERRYRAIAAARDCRK